MDKFLINHLFGILS